MASIKTKIFRRSSSSSSSSSSSRRARRVERAVFFEHFHEFVFQEHTAIRESMPKP